MAWKLAILAMTILGTLPTSLAAGEVDAAPQENVPPPCPVIQWCCNPVLGVNYAWAVECVVTLTDYAMSERD